jgi:lupus La protein
MATKIEAVVKEEEKITETETEMKVDDVDVKEEEEETESSPTNDAPIKTTSSPIKSSPIKSSPSPIKSLSSPIAEDKDDDTEVTTLEKDIIRQMEYYFGDANLMRDKFLLEQIGKDDGWVSLTVLLTFKRLANLSTDPKFIVAALEKANEGLIEIHEDKDKIRRHPERPVPEQNEERRKEIMSRTAYVKGFPLDIEMSDLIDFFKPHDKVTNIVMRKYHDKISKSYLFKGSVFVTFSKKEECAEFLKKEKVEFRDQLLIRKWQEDYIEEKTKEKIKKDKKKNKVVEVEKEFKLPKGTVILLEGFSENVTREDISEAIGELGGTVAYIQFMKGDKIAHVRLTEENSAAKVFEKFEDGKLKVNDDEVTGKILEGEEEATFLENVIKNMKMRRSNNNQHRGGRRGGFGGGNRNFHRKRKGSPDGDDGPPSKH